MTSTSIRPEFPREEGTPAQPPGPGWRGYLTPLGFLGPALFFLVVWMVYPTIATIIRSLFDDQGDSFVFLENYERMFSDDTIITAIKNNAIWVLVVPAAVTALGLVFAVLTERVRWAVAFKIVVFAPLAISLFAAGVIWRIMYQQDPDRGALNAIIAGARGFVADEGVLEDARPSQPEAIGGSTESGLVLNEAVGPGDVAALGLTAIATREVPEGAEQAVAPEALQGGITGTVWRDFKPGGGTAGEVESEELGLPGVTVDLRTADGERVDSVTTASDGTFRFENVESGEYQLAIAPQTFAAPFGGVNWLGEKLITPAIIIAYLWTAAGFAMVVIGAGLASIPRDVLEAARTDGGTEWQVFRRVTVPLLAPVLTVVFVTQIIGVLKVFDIVLSVAPGSTQDDASTLALEMWQRSFSGQNRFGLGSAISTFLLLLFIPFLILNIRRFRAEQAR